MLRRNKKKSGESPYTLLIKLLDILNLQKKDMVDVNLYLKSLSQIYLKKVWNSETIQT